jgi:branched-chain amino acid transport system permease protein
MGGLLSDRRATLLLLALLILVPPFFLPTSYYYRVGALVWISALAAIGLNILMGYAGQVSLGHAGFFGIGAYAVAIGPQRFNIPPMLSLVLGALISAALVWLIGRPILKLKGHYLAIATLGLGMLIALVLTSESGWTGGPDGMSVARLDLWGWKVTGSETWYWVAGGVLMAGAWLALNLEDSRTGRALRALHDSDIAAALIGIDVARHKLAAFVIAGVYTSVAGSLLALFNGFTTPDSAGFLHSIELVTMVVLGGIGSILGSVVGALVLVTLPQILTVFEQYEQVVLGLVIMLVMIFLRRGIVPTVKALFERRSA